MLTPPDILDDTIIAGIHDSFGVRISQATFLPIGADVNGAVYRLTDAEGRPYFLKLRRGNFDEVAVAVPAFLHAQGIRRIMAPIATTSGQLSARADGFFWMLYPYFEGKNGWEVALSPAQWVTLGESMKAVHTTRLPAPLREHVRQDDFGPRLRHIVEALDKQVEQRTSDDPIATSLAAFWMSKREEIQCIVARAAELARKLQHQAPELVVCHADLHAGNVLVGADDDLVIVDWDEVILAPKEHDLMFVGGGLFGAWNQEMEEAWFYEGYGHRTVDQIALAYYRYERIVADLAAYGEQIFSLQGSAEDREEGLRQLRDQFLPNNVVAIAHRTYP